MRLVSYVHDGQVRAGVRVDDRVHELPRAMTMAGVLAAGPAGLAGWDAEPAVALASVTLLPPVPDPPKIICVGINYASHADETGSKRAPTFPCSSRGGRTRWSATARRSSCRRCRSSSTTRASWWPSSVAAAATSLATPALDHVFGYSIFNDASVRDYQRRTSQFTPGKNFDGTGGFGPEIVSADELPPGAKGLRLRTTVAGETLQDATTTELIFDVADLVQPHIPS